MIKSLGKRGVLLSESESECFFIARRYQRQKLVGDITALNRLVWPAPLGRLTWSHSPVRVAAQFVVLLMCMPLIVIWQALNLVSKLLLLPFRMIGTYAIPKGLAAPGEKTIVGVHNAFSRYFDLPAEEYIRCIDEWVSELYGKERAKTHNLHRYIKEELHRGSQVRTEINQPLGDSLRSEIAIAREKLSKELGHYHG